MARKNSQARQAACRICGKDWQIGALAVIPPSGYVCPVCETKQRKERLYGNENTQKRGIQNPAKISTSNSIHSRKMRATRSAGP